MQVSTQNVEDQLFQIHEFVAQNLDEFIRMVIALNARDKGTHPGVQMMTFKYEQQTATREQDSV
jgi:hypothetical protein